MPASSVPPHGSSVPYALELRSITKRFPGVLANDRVDLRVRAGSIHALVGENGTGKTTLMRIAYGELQPDAGEVFISGEPLGRRGPAGAIALGLGLVHQHFMLVPTLSVADNVVLGHEPVHALRLDRGRARARVSETATRFGFAVQPDTRVAELSVGEQQRVEIIKVLSRGARVLILDEPTAVLTPREVDDLFTVLRRFADAGNAVVLISHRLPEVLSHADVITVMRKGAVVGEVSARQADEAQLATWIVGRELEVIQNRRLSRAGEVALECVDLVTQGARNALHGVSLQVHSGEILGVAGVEGNGQHALSEAIVGLQPLERGRVLFGGRDVSRLSCGGRRALGMAYVPADRKLEALVPDMRVDENIILGQHGASHLGRGPWLEPRRVQQHAQRLLQHFGVRPARVDLPVALLSGGNQQRLVLARELDRNPRLLVLAQPTRGVDVGGIAFIHRIILGARDAGKAILLISADLNEIFALADRIAVLFEGRWMGVVDARDADPVAMGLWMTGREVPR